MNKIVAIRRDETGSISEYKLDNGKVLTREQAVEAADFGKISGVSSFTTRDGGSAIRSDRGQYGYALDDLPEF